MKVCYCFPTTLPRLPAEQVIKMTKRVTEGLDCCGLWCLRSVDVELKEEVERDEGRGKREEGRRGGWIDRGDVEINERDCE